MCHQEIFRFLCRHVRHRVDCRGCHHRCRCCDYYPHHRYHAHHYPHFHCFHHPHFHYVCHHRRFLSHYYSRYVCYCLHLCLRRRCAFCFHELLCCLCWVFCCLQQHLWRHLLRQQQQVCLGCFLRCRKYHRAPIGVLCLARLG